MTKAFETTGSIGPAIASLVGTMAPNRTLDESIANVNRYLEKPDKSFLDKVAQGILVS